MIISVASGKGGTGKTTVSVNLALSLEHNVQLIDCDVEEPNAHIFIKPDIKKREPVYIPVPEIDESKCTFCGKCADVCMFNALSVMKKKVLIFSQLCHGCGSCTYHCPSGVVKEVNRETGFIETGIKSGLQFVHGKLNIGEAMSPPVIRAVKKHIDNTKTVIIDAPPGTSCPVISSIKDNDYCILVTEPTPFGLNDLILAVEMVKTINIPFGVVINRSDMGNKDLEEYLKKEGIKILLKIPFKKEIAHAYSNGISIIEVFPEYKEKFQTLFKSIEEQIA